jgi:hypothetical protein
MTMLVCGHCKEPFEPADDETWDDDKARAEVIKNFPDVPIEECSIVCEDCYHYLMKLAGPLAVALGHGAKL